MQRRLAIILSLLLFTLILFGCGNGGRMSVGSLRLTPDSDACWQAGFGQAVIALPESEHPFYIAGYKNGVGITGVLDPQCATALWLDCGGGGLLLVGIDCVGIGKDQVDAIRADIKNTLGDECVSVNVFATHTHAGIDTLGLWGPMAVDGKNPDFMKSLRTAAVEAARRAFADRRRGKLFISEPDTSELFGGSPIQRDSREPQVFDTRLHQLRFVPDGGGSGIRIVSYAAHAEALRGENTLVSRDFPGAMADAIMADCGDRLLFMSGAVGGLIMTEDIRSDRKAETMIDNMRRTGELLAKAALSGGSDETELAPTLSAARAEFFVPLDNTVFMYYKFLGILGNRAVPGEGATGYELGTELSVINIGGVALALIPGEIFPELISGDTDERTLEDIAREQGFGRLMICGLANDELGYIIPERDFLVSEKAPYLEDCPDGSGEDHYEETNSTGPRTYARIAEAFAAVIDELCD